MPGNRTRVFSSVSDHFNRSAKATTIVIAIANGFLHDDLYPSLPSSQVIQWGFWETPRFLVVHLSLGNPNNYVGMMLWFVCREWGFCCEFCHWEHYTDSGVVYQDQGEVSCTQTIALISTSNHQWTHRMVLGFLEQLEQWRTSSADKAQTTLAGKVRLLMRSALCVLNWSPNC